MSSLLLILFHDVLTDLLLILLNTTVITLSTPVIAPPSLPSLRPRVTASGLGGEPRHHVQLVSAEPPPLRRRPAQDPAGAGPTASKCIQHRQGPEGGR